MNAAKILDRRDIRFSSYKRSRTNSDDSYYIQGIFSF
jgi:hypothetical protein